MRFLAAAVLTLCLCAPAPSFAQDWSPGRADSHAPIGVMGDHTHERGELMLSFRYMRMDMDGNRDGTTSLSTGDVLAGFPVSPLRMAMDMYMIGAMYAPSDRVTLMGMLPVTGLSMDHVTRMNVGFTTTANGIGDASVTAMIVLARPEHQRIHFNAGISLPTGSIDRRGDTPAATNVILPYPMQLGSGTADLRPGLTWLGQAGQIGWGVQGTGVVRLGDNDRGYHLGNRFGLTGWISRVLSNSASISFRVASSTWGDVSGADSGLNPNMVPTADPRLRGGTRIDLGGGLNLEKRGGALNGHRLSIEVLVPVYQRLNGPQLETDWSVVIGWQKAWALRR